MEKFYRNLDPVNIDEHIQLIEDVFDFTIAFMIEFIFPDMVIELKKMQHTKSDLLDLQLFEGFQSLIISKKFTCADVQAIFETWKRIEVSIQAMPLNTSVDGFEAAVTLMRDFNRYYV